ncbi:MAG: hypothetical protein LBD35_06940 [Prevotellaceae bacterium]|nr:hypothetical protein [Prevotellaceae bacterium]
MENYVIRYIRPEPDTDFFIFADNISEDSVKFYLNFIPFTHAIINPIAPADENMRSEFRRIARNNGDTAYNRPIGTCFQHPCFADGESRIDVRCDAECAGYSAGESLSELFFISFFSPEDFVRNGYAATEATSPASPVNPHFMQLSKFNEKKQSMLSARNIELSLKAELEEFKTYTFYFSYSDKSNLVLRDTMQIKK